MRNIRAFFNGLWRYRNRFQNRRAPLASRAGPRQDVGPDSGSGL